MAALVFKAAIFFMINYFLIVLKPCSDPDLNR
jgi:hypothetical protein